MATILVSMVATSDARSMSAVGGKADLMVAHAEV
jgi:hypothetical protein